MANEDSWLRIGSEIGARYEVLAHLGAGGMGVVYEVLDRRSDERIALKVLRQGQAEPRLLTKEFRALAGVTHPNLVQLYDLFDEDGVIYLTMELVRGKDFVADLVGTGTAAHGVTVAMPTETDATAPVAQPSQPTLRLGAPPLELIRVRERFGQLARGLAALHRRGLVHRDIKPQNVRVTPDGRVVILDFGLATMAGVVGSVAGTVTYMAPEQAEGAPVRASCDWYSFGILLHEVLTGSTPWTGSARDLMRRKQVEDLPPLRGREGVPDDLAAMVDALVQRDPDQRPDDDQVLEWFGESREVTEQLPSAVIGRRSERAQLDAAWRATVAGSTAWLAIEGASGLGKTTLMSAFEQTIDGEVLRGRCYEREAVAYKGIDEIVDALVARLIAHGIPTPEAIDLVHAFPSALELVPVGAEVLPASRIGHDRRGAALRALLTRLAEVRPVVIALDDIQWADRDCLALLAQALGAPGIPRLLFVVTARPGATARWHDLPMPFVHISLGRLDAGEGRELAQLLAGDAAAPQELDELVRQAGGFPMEIMERVRALLVANAATGPEAAANAHELIQRRVADATADVRLLVELVVTAGAPVPVIAVGRAAGFTEVQLRGAIDRAQLSALVRTRRHGARMLIEPAHDQIREVLFAALAPAERRARATALAPVLEAAEHEPAHAAELYVLAEDPDAARRCATQAAETMGSHGGHDAAAELWRLVASLSSGAARSLARRRTADSLTRAGRGAEAADIYRELAVAGTDPDERRRDLRSAAEQLLRGGRIDEGLALIEQALGEKEPRGDRRTLVRGLALHAATRAAARLGRRPTPRAISREELDLRWAAIAGYTLGSTGHFVHAVEQYLRAALASGEPDHISLAWSTEATLGTFLGDTRFVDACMLRAGAAMRDLESPRALAVATATSGLIQLCAGSWARADAVAADAAELFDRMPELVWERNTASVITTTARAHRGDLAGLAGGVRRERERIAACGDLYAHEIAHSGFAVLVDLLLDDASRTTERLEVLTARPTGVYTAWLRLLAHGLVGAYGDKPVWHAERAEALHRGPLSLPLVRGSLVLGTSLWTRIIGELSAHGVTPRALAWIDRLRSTTVRGMHGLAELLSAHAAALAGDRAAARERAAAAELMLATDDMAMFAASARWLVDPSTWPTWRDQLAKAGAVKPAALARVFAPSFR